MSKTLMEVVTNEDADNWETLRFYLDENFDNIDEVVSNEEFVKSWNKLGYEVKVKEMPNGQIEMEIINIT